MTVIGTWSIGKRNATVLYAAVLLVGSIALCSLPLGGQFCFVAPESYPAGDGPISVTTADFNEDGHVDLAVVNGGSWDVGCNCYLAGGLSVRLGDGLGGFSTAVSYVVGDRPISVCCADLDEDGHVDLAVADTEGSDVSVLIGDGLGAFATPVSYGAGDAPTSLVAADFNEDGHLDLAVGNAVPGVTPDVISLLLGDGLGALGPAVTYAAGGDNPTSLTTADFNEDGHADLALANGPNGAVSVLLGDGLSGFSAPLSYAAGEHPIEITTGDFDEDGHLDLAVVNFLVDDASVMLGDGLGGFAAAVSYPCGGVVHSVTTGDFNEDGHLDLAGAGVVAPGSYGGFVSLLLGDGPSGFGPPVSYALLYSSETVIAGDFNEDGHLDLAVTNPVNNTFSVILTYGCDCNGNGIWDPQDTGSGTSEDCNWNTIPDECEVTTDDCNANGIWDECEIVSGTAEDCNGNGIPDECDIASTFSDDINGNGVPDECDPGAFSRGDCDIDGLSDFADALVLLFFLFVPGASPLNCHDSCDANDDGTLDVGDAIAILSLAFGSPPSSLPQPHPGCGHDPTDPDGLDCVAYSVCP